MIHCFFISKPAFEARHVSRKYTCTVHASRLRNRMAWFWRGAQSAIFYYLSCAPCTSYAHQRKRQKANRRAKATKYADDEINAGYIHPSPFDTNPHWHEEMAMGPSGAQKKGKEKHKVDSTRRLNTGGQGSSAGESSMESTLAVQSIQEAKEEEPNQEDNGWNRKRYQRVDEFLWGSEDKNDSYASIGSRGANKPLVSGDGAYYSARNPAVSELHPPVMSSQPTHASQTRWMLQPPPSAKLMDGKERASRSRSASNTSTNSFRGTGGAMAGRQASQRRPRSRTTPEVAHKDNPNKNGQKIRPRQDIGAEDVSDQQYNVEADLSGDSDSAISAPSRKKRPPPIQISDPSKPNPVKHKSSRARARTPLSTIQSSHETSMTDQNGLRASGTFAADGAKDLKSASALSVSSLQVLQELVPTSPSLNTQAPSPSEEVNIRLPAETEIEKRLLSQSALGRENYRFPANESAHLARPMEENRRPASRWSMDI